MEPDRKQYNLLAAFRGRGGAEEALRRLAEGGIPREDLSIHGPETVDGDRRDESYAEMQDEVSTSVAGPSIFATSEQAKGAVVGTIPTAVLGALLGVVVGLVWAFGVDSSMSQPFRLIVPTIAFALAGATVGFVAGGALKPRLEGMGDPSRTYDDERLEAESDVLVAVHTDDEGGLERAEGILRQLSPERLDHVHPSGAPLPPQASDPRPADTPDRWWKGPPTG